MNAKMFDIQLSGSEKGIDGKRVKNHKSQPNSILTFI